MTDEPTTVDLLRDVRADMQAVEGTRANWPIGSDMGQLLHDCELVCAALARSEERAEKAEAALDYVPWRASYRAATERAQKAEAQVATLREALTLAAPWLPVASDADRATRAALAIPNPRAEALLACVEALRMYAGSTNLSNATARDALARLHDTEGPS